MGVVTNYGEGCGLQNGRGEGGGQVKFYPYKKRGGGVLCRHACVCVYIYIYIYCSTFLGIE